MSDTRLDTSRWASIGTVAAITAFMLVLVAAVLVRPEIAGLTPRAGSTQTTDISVDIDPTGETTTVEVIATTDMTFEPSIIEVPAGNELQVTIVNQDPLNGHDLKIGDVETGRIQPGQTVTTNFGVMTTTQQGYCTVAGHREMGMTLDVVVLGGSEADHSAHTPQSSIAPPDGAVVSEPIPAELPPLGADNGPVTHEVTLTVTEVPLEIAPGLYQTRWTFNGASVGPTLHGRVGDRFVITLVNDGTIGHSIDFHAGALAPDGPMRTIAPGESLEYVFTAERAGIWMYHCGSHPMSTHIAQGMHGAVVIEPRDLEPVDKQFVFVQSEIYLANEALTPEDAQELDASKIAAREPDFLAFNGIADQYMQHKLQVRVGERVRIWILDAGPDVELSFHIVGGQFDTSWNEGHYTLKQGRSAFGETDGGAQVLPLLAAQGGFVELVFPEAGNYTMINHVMSEGERGARGVFHVID